MTQNSPNMNETSISRNSQFHPPSESGIHLFHSPVAAEIQFRRTNGFLQKLVCEIVGFEQQLLWNWVDSHNRVVNIWFFWEIFGLFWLSLGFSFSLGPLFPCETNCCQCQLCDWYQFQQVHCVLRVCDHCPVSLLLCGRGPRLISWGLSQNQFLLKGSITLTNATVVSVGHLGTSYDQFFTLAPSLAKPLSSCAIGELANHGHTPAAVEQKIANNV